MGPKIKKSIDPLFAIFEKHLLNRSYEDSAAFTKEVAEAYLTYLDSTPAHLPLHVRANILEDLEGEAHEMLVKKMYGLTSPAQYSSYGKVTQVSIEGPIRACEFLIESDIADSKPKPKV